MYMYSIILCTLSHLFNFTFQPSVTFILVYKKEIGCTLYISHKADEGLLVKIFFSRKFVIVLIKFKECIYYELHTQ